MQLVTEFQLGRGWSTGMDPETFIAVSSWVNTTLLAGVPLRILASATLAATFWFGAYKQRIALGFLFFMRRFCCRIFGR